MQRSKPVKRDSSLCRESRTGPQKSWLSAILTWLEQMTRDVGASAPVLSDMAWTAGMSRSHFPYRVGAPFENAAQLREGLRALVEADEADEEWQPRVPTRVAFVYNVLSTHLASVADELYRREPVVRTVLDRCEELFQAERRKSLLDAIFGRFRSKWSVAAQSGARPLYMPSSVR